MTGDAKIYAMIDDLSETALAMLITDDRPRLIVKSRQLILDEYEAGNIETDEIIAAWEDDADAS